MIIYEAVEWTFYNDSQRKNHIAYFQTEEDARIVTQNRSANGIPAGEKVPQREVFNLATWMDKEAAKNRAEGLKKLTAQEREALGL